MGPRVPTVRNLHQAHGKQADLSAQNDSRLTDLLMTEILILVECPC
jgi:hypothetical protein